MNGMWLKDNDGMDIYVRPEGRIIYVVQDAKSYTIFDHECLETVEAATRWIENYVDRKVFPDLQIWAVEIVDERDPSSNTFLGYVEI